MADKMPDMPAPTIAKRRGLPLPALCTKGPSPVLDSSTVVGGKPKPLRGTSGNAPLATPLPDPAPAPAPGACLRRNRGGLLVLALRPPCDEKYPLVSSSSRSRAVVERLGPSLHPRHDRHRPRVGGASSTAGILRAPWAPHPRHAGRPRRGAPGDRPEHVRPGDSSETPRIWLHALDSDLRCV